jgi:hypothetical protein
VAPDHVLFVCFGVFALVIFQIGSHSVCLLRCDLTNFFPQAGVDPQSS